MRDPAKVTREGREIVPVFAVLERSARGVAFLTQCGAASCVGRKLSVHLLWVATFPSLQGLLLPARLGDIVPRVLHALQVSMHSIA